METNFRKACCSPSPEDPLGDSPLLGPTQTCLEGPFGEVIRATGPMAKANPFRFSTKYQDDETDLVYYGYRYYSASMGRWSNRDPFAENGGRNLYAASANNLLGRVDVLGLRPIHLEFNAFIPGPPDWMVEPGQPGSTHYWFATDGRGFVRQPEQTARLRTEATIESTLIGVKVKQSQVLSETVASDSKRYDADSGNVEIKQATPSGGATLWPSSGSCELTIKMSGSGKYPFTPQALTPSIDYSVTWTLKAVGSNRVKVTVEGTHDNFPAHEAVLDWSAGVYAFTSPDSGPNPINLATSVPFRAEKEIEAETQCCVLQWPP
jgi:RHS repeat-associated protein